MIASMLTFAARRLPHPAVRLIRRAVPYVPVGSLRNQLLVAFAGVELAPGASIGFGTVVDAERMIVGRGTLVGRWNRFTGPISVTIGERCSIGDHNEFVCGDWVLEEQFADEGYERTIRFGDGCLVTDRHMFDVCGTIEVGAGSWFAGRRSQVWTHGVGIADRDVRIGERCYVGAAVLIAPGAALGDDNVVSLGSIVTRDLSGVTEHLIGGAPAEPIKPLGEDFASGRLHRFRLGSR